MRQSGHNHTESTRTDHTIDTIQTTPVIQGRLQVQEALAEYIIQDPQAAHGRLLVHKVLTDNNNQDPPAAHHGRLQVQAALADTQPQLGGSIVQANNIIQHHQTQTVKASKSIATERSRDSESKYRKEKN